MLNLTNTQTKKPAKNSHAMEKERGRGAFSGSHRKTFSKTHRQITPQINHTVNTSTVQVVRWSLKKANGPLRSHQITSCGGAGICRTALHGSKQANNPLFSGIRTSNPKPKTKSENGPRLEQYLVLVITATHKKFDDLVCHRGPIDFKARPSELVGLRVSAPFFFLNANFKAGAFQVHGISSISKHHSYATKKSA